MRFVMFTIHAILIHGIYILLALIKTKDSNMMLLCMETSSISDVQNSS